MSDLPVWSEIGREGVRTDPEKEQIIEKVEDLIPRLVDHEGDTLPM
jgi:hypothetical protein